MYSARVSSNDKLFQLDLATGQKTQLTFGTHDDMAAKFFNTTTLVFTSTAMDPKVPLAPEVAQNGNIPNIWTMDLTTRQLQQLTDTTQRQRLAGACCGGSDAMRVAFVTYYKGQEQHPHRLPATACWPRWRPRDFGEPGPIVEFTPQMATRSSAENIHKKGKFEGLSLAGRPPIALGVTSSGNFYGNTEVTFTDLLGDQQISFYSQSVSQYRAAGVQLPHHREAPPVGAAGLHRRTLFYYGQNCGPLQTLAWSRSSTAIRRKPCRASGAPRPS